ncbi:MAG TPA: hypothetical protein VMI56_17080 [Reyranella sp.]|nr:hypothetical protein [Reyranella sp.]
MIAIAFLVVLFIGAVITAVVDPHHHRVDHLVDHWTVLRPR